MFALSCVGLIIWIFAYIGVVISGKDLGRMTILRYWLLFVVSFATFCFFAEPSISDDLYRHYYMIDILRAGGSLKGTFVDTMFIFKWILMIVAKTHNNGWLPFSAIIIWGCLIYKIIKKYLDTEEYNTRGVFLYILALLGTFCSFNLVSGIRAALTVAIFVFSVYYYYLEGKKIRHYVLVMTFSFLHFMVLLLVIAQLLYELILFMRKRGFHITWIVLVSAAIVFSTSIVGQLFANQAGILGFISDKWFLYQEWTRELTFELVVYWTGMLYVLLSGFKIRDNTNKLDFRFQFPQLLVLISIATNMMPIVANRMPMPVAALSLPILNKACSRSSGSVWTLWSMLGYLVLSLEAIYLIYAMFGFITFNGINIQELIRGLL